MQTIPRLAAIINQLLRHPKNISSAHLAVGELIFDTEELITREWFRLVKDTALAQAVLFIRIIPAEQQCMVCFQKYRPLDQETSCPQCGSVGAKIITGEEFYLESVEE